jgi:hypothetical protein
MNMLHYDSVFLLRKGNANFVMKWKESKREASVKVTMIKGLNRDIKGNECKISIVDTMVS